MSPLSLIEIEAPKLLFALSNGDNPSTA